MAAQCQAIPHMPVHTDINPVVVLLLLCVHMWTSGFSEWATIGLCVNNWNKVISAVLLANYGPTQPLSLFSFPRLASNSSLARSNHRSPYLPLLPPLNTQFFLFFIWSCPPEVNHRTYCFPELKTKILIVKKFISWPSQPRPGQTVTMSAVFSPGSRRPFSEHTRPALIRALAQDWWNGANIDSIWARQIAPPSCVLSLSLSFAPAQFPSNLPLPLSLTFPFIPFLLRPFFSLPLCPPSVSLPLLSAPGFSGCLYCRARAPLLFSAELGAFMDD